MSHITRKTQVQEMDDVYDMLRGLGDEPDEDGRYINTKRGRKKLEEFERDIKEKLFMKWIAKKYPEELL